jgi:hypothetical protein
MGKQKNRERHYDLAPEQLSTGIPNTDGVQAARGNVLQESAHVSEVGALKHRVKVVNVAASPSKQGRGARSSALGQMHTERQQEIWPGRSFCKLVVVSNDCAGIITDTLQEPVYDLLPLDEEGVDAEGRDLRDSVSEFQPPDLPRNSYLPQDDPMRQWVEDHREIFANEQIRWEGCGDHRSGVCPRCSKGTAEYRCTKCVNGGELLCRECLLAGHRQLPFHPILVCASIFRRTASLLMWSASSFGMDHIIRKMLLY